MHVTSSSMDAFILHARRAIHSWSFDVRIEMDLVEVWERGRWRGGRLGLGADLHMEQDDDRDSDAFGKVLEMVYYWKL